jgi:hypothetical protein
MKCVDVAMCGTDGDAGATSSVGYGVSDALGTGCDTGATLGADWGGWADRLVKHVDVVVPRGTGWGSEV